MSSLATSLVHLRTARRRVPASRFRCGKFRKGVKGGLAALAASCYFADEAFARKPLLEESEEWS